MSLWPTAAPERALAAAELARVHAPVGSTGGWRSARFFLRAGGFILGSIAAFAWIGLVALFIDRDEWAVSIAGLIVLIAAEVLIARMKLFAHGVEEALWTIAAIALVAPLFELSNWALVLAMALAVAAARLINPLLACAATLLLAFYIGENTHAPQAPIFTFAIALSALVLAARRFARPSHDRIVAWLLVTMPAATYLFALDEGTEARVLAVVALAAFGAGAMTVGIRLRLHPPILAALVAIAAIAFEVRERIELDVAGALIGGGAVVLTAALVIERRLRGRTRGLTAADLGDESRQLALFEQLGTSILAASSRPETPREGSLQRGDGKFGGAGASGSY